MTEVFRPNSENLVWIDLEMTGLDPATDSILQVAIAITTPDLAILDELAVDVSQPEQVLARMTPFVQEMHTRTGLVDRVRRSIVDVQAAERMLLERIAARCPSPATLCGNSVWIDRAFISHYMPALNNYFHYRIVDVSSIKVLAQRWYGDLAVYAKSPRGEHDALVDVRNSILELRHYRQTLFRALDTQGAQRSAR